MRQLIIVVATSIAILVFWFTHQYGGALGVGIAVGAFYFLKAVVTGGGIAEVRITRDPGVPRKPNDPAGSIGMGLAAAGIAAGAMGSDEYTQGLGPFLPSAIALGLLIANGYAIYALLLKRKASAADPALPASENGAAPPRNGNGSS